jgi:hypothetical protein
MSMVSRAPQGLAAVKTAIGKDKLFAAVVLPGDYTSRMLTLTGTTPQRPH